MTHSLAFPDDVPTLTDGVVTLRAHRPSDAPAVLEQCTDPVSIQWTTVPVPYSLADAEAFVSGTTARAWEDGSVCMFAVEAIDDDGTPRFCGTVELRDMGSKRAEIAYGSHPWVRGRGVMQRALNLLLDWGFEQQGLGVVLWMANVGNWASRRTAWKLGFSCDGTLPGWLAHRGELIDGWVGVLHADDERAPRTDWLEVPRIAGEGVVLRPFEDRDAERIVQACSEERIQHWFHAMPSPYTIEDARAYLLTRGDGPARGTGVGWALADPASDELVGSISLFDIKAGREAEIGYWAHPAARGRGLMSEACGLVVRHAFETLGLQRIQMYAAAGNSASRHVIEVNGFTQVGIGRRATPLRDGSVDDEACYDQLADEWLARTGG